MRNKSSCFTLMFLSITQKWRNIPKSVFGEPVAIVVDLQNGIEIGFETGEIMRLKMC